jgi:glycerol-3-phosphate dehydrogenase
MQTTTEHSYDLIVIGAGINGAGIARDAALRGLSVLLLDKGDIGGGTSSVSTRLIHGGLRYLEHGEVGLVRESLRERETLLRIAPHLVRPLPLIVPIYQQQQRSRLAIRAGMMAYDALSVHKSLPRHRMLNSDETLKEAPGLNSSGLLGAALYFDAQVEFAERLVLENVLSANEHGASVHTYSQVDGFTIEESKIRGVQYRDLLTGERRCVQTSIVINAAGPWVDDVIGITKQNSNRLIGGTKGSHIIVGPFAGAPRTAVYVEAHVDRRPLFIIPWNGNYLIGTTDTRFEGDLNAVEIYESEKGYLLQEANRYFPEARLTAASIKYCYSGVRPLAFTDDQSESAITRRHFVREHPSLDGLLSIVGGKLTTYRHLAEEAVDLVMRKLGRKEVRVDTAKIQLPGGSCNSFKDVCVRLQRESGLPSSVSTRLLRIYGTRTTEVTQLLKNDPALGELIDSESGALAAEVVFSFENEMARTLSDCLLRRTMVGLNSSCGTNALEAAAMVGRKFLGWSEERARHEMQEYRDLINPRLKTNHVAQRSWEGGSR